nr:MAG TPA: hypothetical protein [Caudoviricetes sp.]
MRRHSSVNMKASGLGVPKVLSTTANILLEIGNFYRLNLKTITRAQQLII